MTEEDRVARVARALCIADGNDPEEHIYVGSGVVEKDGALTTDTGKARRMIAAVRAIGW